MKTVGPTNTRRIVTENRLCARKTKDAPRTVRRSRRETAGASPGPGEIPGRRGPRGVESFFERFPARRDERRNTTTDGRGDARRTKTRAADALRVERRRKRTKKIATRHDVQRYTCFVIDAAVSFRSRLLSDPRTRLAPSSIVVQTAVRKNKKKACVFFCEKVDRRRSTSASPE